MTDESRKFSRKLLCLAVAGACMRSAFAGPAGPVVHAGSASYDPATLTVTSATARTQILWQSFNVAAGEVVNFVQPNVQSAVLNQVFNPQSIKLLGSVKSNASVLFMSNGSVSGPGVQLDLAGMISTSLRLPANVLAQTGVAALAQPRPLATLAGGSIYVLSQDAQAVTAVNGDVVLNPGKSVELVAAAMPNLRVVMSAPEAESINLNRLLEGKRELGIFAGLFRASAAARQAVQRDTETVLTASANAQSRDLERFYRYAVLYARTRGETRQQGGGLLPVAAAPAGNTMLPAIRSRPSVLPSDIEIGALRPQELALRPAYLPLGAEAERHPAMPERQAVSIAAKSAAQADGAPVLVYAAAEPPADRVAMRISQPVTLAAASTAPADSAPVLVYAAAEPPADKVATRISQPVTLAVASAAPADSAPVLVYAAAEPPADRVATRISQPVTLAVASAAPADSAPVLVYAAAEPPVQSTHVQLAQREAESLPIRHAPRSAPAIVVVALAQHSAAPASQEESRVKEVRIERRAPRYFTDYRGAMFFM